MSKNTNELPATAGTGLSVEERLGKKYGINPDALKSILFQTAFKQIVQTGVPSDAEVTALLLVADRYNLNPFTREIYAVRGAGGIIPVVGYDGWINIANSQPEYDHPEFTPSENKIQIDKDAKECFESMTCSIYLKDRSQPIRITEYLDEVYQPARVVQDYGTTIKVPGAWQTHTKRQLRTKTFNQACRIAFGLSGIYDPDEADRIIHSGLNAVPAEHASEVTAKPVGSAVTLSDTSVQKELSEQQKKHVVDVIDEVVDRMKSSNAWQSAYSFADDRFSGAELEYAVTLLNEAKMIADSESASASMPNETQAEAKPPVSEVRVTEAEPEKTVEEPSSSEAVEDSSGAKPETQTSAVDHSKLDAFANAVIKIAIDNGGQWGRATHFAEKRLKGNDLEYVKSRLYEAEKAAIQPEVEVGTTGVEAVTDQPSEVDQPLEGDVLPAEHFNAMVGDLGGL